MDLGLSVCDPLYGAVNQCWIVLTWVQWCIYQPQVNHTTLSGIIYSPHTLYKGEDVCNVCWWNRKGGGGAWICVFVLWAELKLLTELKIISQEGCLCETEVQESRWNTHTHWSHRQCEASCLGPRLCVWAKESTAFHITDTVQQILVLQSAHLPLRIERNWEIKVEVLFLTSENLPFSWIRRNRTMCSIFDVPPPLSFLVLNVCVCVW